MELLSTDEAAKYLGLQPQTLRVWRMTGQQNLPYLRVGGRLVKYAKEDLDEFIRQGRNR